MARTDSIYELKIAFDQIPDKDSPPSPLWLADRVFRHLPTDLAGNTHRAEFCIDKLYSPDAAGARLGLVELRAFEMPPHAQMSLTQQLLVRALTAHFWETPYRRKLEWWRTMLHDRFMLPHFVQLDWEDVMADLREAGYDFETEWFAPHFEFRFPLLGAVTAGGVRLELRHALARAGRRSFRQRRRPQCGFVRGAAASESERNDRRSLRGRMQWARRVPLHSTGAVGAYVTGVRYRAWQPPSYLSTWACGSRILIKAGARHSGGGLEPARGFIPAGGLPDRHLFSIGCRGFRPCIPIFRYTRRWSSTSWTRGPGTPSAVAHIM